MSQFLLSFVPVAFLSDVSGSSTAFRVRMSYNQCTKTDLTHLRAEI